MVLFSLPGKKFKKKTKHTYLRPHIAPSKSIAGLTHFPPLMHRRGEGKGACVEVGRWGKADG